jgi:hypothetical protein
MGGVALALLAPIFIVIIHIISLLGMKQTHISNRNYLALKR